MERGGGFTMAISVLNQEAFCVRNQNSFSHSMATQPPREESRKDPPFQNQEFLFFSQIMVSMCGKRG